MLTFTITCFVLSGLAFGLLVIACRAPRPVIRVVPVEEAPTAVPVYTARHRRPALIVRLLAWFGAGWRDLAHHLMPGGSS